MLAIQPTAPQKCTPNLLPARINHNGRINNTTRYWTPTVDEKDTPHASFRGRHLHGTTLALPPNYTGAVLNITDRVAPQSTNTNIPSSHDSHDNGNDSDLVEDGDDEIDHEIPEEVKVAEQIGEFDEVVVWGHGGVVDEGDAFVRGIREWVGFAESMHCDGDDDDWEGSAAKEEGSGEKKA